MIKMCRVLDLSTKEIRSKNKRQDLCDGRKIICFVLRYYGLTLEEIGRLLKKDHSTVGYNIKEYEVQVINNRNFRFKVELIKTLLENENITNT